MKKRYLFIILILLSLISIFTRLKDIGIKDVLNFKNIVFILLIGIMLGNIIDSFTTFFAYRFDLVQNISTWLFQ